MTERYQGFTFDQSALHEDVEIDVDRRKEILFLEARLGKLTHWEVLGLPWSATAEQARAAYIEKVKVFHPDRYPGRFLGSYLARLERVFKRLTEAGDVLADEARRAIYLRESATSAQLAVLEAGRLEEEKRSQERRARLRRQNPLLVRAERLGEFIRRGKKALAEGHYSQAANDLQIALSIDKEKAELVPLIAEAKRKAGAAKASEYFDRGTEAEVMGQPAAALAAFREAIAVDATHVRAASSAARVALRLGETALARTFAEAALKSGPRIGLAHEAMGLVLEAEGSKREARQLFEKAVELDPKLENSKERLKKLRWSFRG